MMTGPAGWGKTLAAKSLINGLDRPNFYFNLGATQDPRATLIGNVHFDKKKGTFFSESLFVKAIQTPNAVILLELDVIFMRYYLTFKECMNLNKLSQEFLNKNPFFWSLPINSSGPCSQLLESILLLAKAASTSTNPGSSHKEVLITTD